MNEHEQFMLRYDLQMDAGSDRAEIMVYGQIVNYKYDEKSSAVTASDFDKLLKEAAEKGAKKLHLRINSPGGNVWQAIAMRTMLMTSRFDEISAAIEGLCASAATLLCCLPNIRVSIAEGSEYMIHNPSSIAFGTASEMRKEADRMEKMEGDVREIYANRCGKGVDEVKDMMDAETWMTAREAVESGFCDEVLEAAQVTACASEEQMEAMRRMYANIPESVCIAQVGMEEVSNANNAAEHNTNSKEDETGMDGKEIKDITMQELEAQNPGLVSEVIARDRERVQEIDDLTPAGYEQMAKDAKEKGTSAAEYLKMIVKAQREKGAEFMSARTAEVKSAEQVPGGEPGNNDPAADMKAFAKEMGEYAKAMSAGNEGMY